MRWLLCTCAMLGCAIAPSAWAQQTTPQSDDSIVVTAKPVPPAKTAHKFVGQVVDLSEGQLARFDDPICLTVTGMAPKLTAAFERRFRTVAAEAGVRMKSGKCTTNLMVLFVVDTANFMQGLRKNHRMFLADLADADKIDALRPEPIRSWRTVVLRDEVGNTSSASNRQDGPTSFETPTRTVTLNAFLVMDRSTVPGKTIQQIADYAAMRTLVGARPPRKGSIIVDSILSLFDPEVAPPPRQLSELDHRLMAGLYSMHASVAEEDSHAQGYDLSRRMVKKPKP